MKIKISVAAYNEIATALERLGVKADGTTELTLEKGTQLSCPIDFKMVTIRRDVATIAATCYKDGPIVGNFVMFCNQLYEWILSEEKVNVKLTEPPTHLKGGWK